jgi:hypothetical protein
MMLHKSSLIALVVTSELMLMFGSAAAFDDSKYPNWSGQWRRPPGVGTQWDQTKTVGLAQRAPLTPEYQARLEASIADQAGGGQGEDARVSCITAGMPRIMTGTCPFELVVLPAITYVYGEGNMPRRIYTDGRSFPTDEEPTYMGYSVGKWIDEDGDGKYDVLEVGTRNFKGPRTYEFSGIRLHDDNESVIKERFFLDKASPAIGMTMRGEPALRARINRATTLYPVGPRTRTMMQPCASAAKLRSGGPILFFGMRAMEIGRDPPPRTIGDPSQANGLGQTCWVPSATSVHCAGRRTTPSGTTPSRTNRHKAIRSCAPRPLSWSCDCRGRSRCGLETTAPGHCPSGT